MRGELTPWAVLAGIVLAGIFLAAFIWVVHAVLRD